MAYTVFTFLIFLVSYLLDFLNLLEETADVDVRRHGFSRMQLVAFKRLATNPRNQGPGRDLGAKEANPSKS